MSRLEALVTARCDSRPVALARMVFGAASLIEATTVQPMLVRLADPLVAATPYVSGLPRPGPALVALIYGVWVLAALCFVLGWRARTAGVVLTGAMAFTLALDQQLYSNHLYLMAVMALLLTLADSGASLSLDAVRRGGRDDLPAWPVTLIRLQVSLVYGFSALAKLNLAYLSGAALAFELSRGAFGLPDALRRVEVMAPLAVLSILVEALLAVALWSPRHVRLAVGLGVLLHAGIVALLAPGPGLATFALVMFAGYLVVPGVVARVCEGPAGGLVSPR